MGTQRGTPEDDPHHADQGGPGAQDGSGEPVDIEPYHQMAAELVLGDEAWREDLTDWEASPLLHWALARLPEALANSASHGVNLDDLASEIARQARATLSWIVMHRHEYAGETLLDAAGEQLHPPLFVDTDAGRQALHDALVEAELLVDEDGGGRDEGVER